MDNIKAENVVLRPFSVDDISQLALLANNINVAKMLTDQFPHPYTEEHAKLFIELHSTTEPLKVLAIEVNRELAGAIGIHPQEDVFRKNAELGYWLAESFWGSGIMTIAVKKMVNYAFETFDISRVFARPFGNNLASQRVLEKAGFIKEAGLKGTIVKQGVVLDELIYAIRK